MPHPAALLVIDVQESFRHRPYWSATHAPAFFDRLQALIDGAAERKIPVVQILHIEDEGAFSLASGHVRTLAPLAITPDAVFHKHRHSALIGSGLPVWLTERGIRRLRRIAEQTHAALRLGEAFVEMIRIEIDRHGERADQMRAESDHLVLVGDHLLAKARQTGGPEVRTLHRHAGADIRMVRPQVARQREALLEVGGRSGEEIVDQSRGRAAPADRAFQARDQRRRRRRRVEDAGRESRARLPGRAKGSDFHHRAALALLDQR